MSLVALTGLLLLYLVELRDLLIPVYLVGAVIGSYYFAKESVEHIFVKRKVTTDVIMTLAIIGAAILGEFEESLTIVFLYSITETLESYTVRRTKYSIRSLIKLVPPEANKVVGNNIVLTRLEDLAVGDMVRINAGDVIPTDGIVERGSAYINESAITGESVPVHKADTDKVLSGTTCDDGSVDYEVTHLPSESTVNNIIRLVQDAQTRKVRTQLLIERFTKYYNPFVLVFAILVFVIPALITAEVSRWAILGITVLVASAPCALVISSPVTMYSAISSAARKGILAKGGVHLEGLSKIEAVVFDKTGTLTHGKPVIQDIITVDEGGANILQIAGSLERHSNHPLARAVVEEMGKQQIQPLEVRGHRTIAGEGVEGTINGKTWFFGSRQGLQLIQTDTVDKLKNEGKSVSYLIHDNKLVAIIGFADTIRSSSVQAVEELNKRQVPVFLLSGDGKEATQQVASQLGVSAENVFWEMKPEEKMQKIEELKSQYKLAMIGDGINDAPALAIADVGIAMGASGTGVALETADIAIMSDDLYQLVKSVSIGRDMRSIIMQNIIISLFILSALMIGVLVGIVNITAAILIHEGTEVLIVANAMKLFLKSY